MTLLPIVVKKDVRRPIHSGLNLVSERLTFPSIVFGLEFLEPQRFIIKYFHDDKMIVPCVFFLKLLTSVDLFDKPKIELSFYIPHMICVLVRYA